tara:strand:- start:133 stop:747 length:615 start_codon:yes stop_codon:yes gene_type:complete
MTEITEITGLTKYQSQVMPIGIVYRCFSNTDDKIYYGSCSCLQSRIKSHNSPGNQCMTRLINGELQFEMLEQHRDIRRYDLKIRERFFMDNHKDTNRWIINKNTPTGTAKEYHKKRYAKSPELWAAIQKVYYWKNRDKELARIKKYAESIKGQVWHCDICNCDVSLGGKSKHKKTEKHLSNVSTTTATKCIPTENLIGSNTTCC